jgi:hypothetical protein
MFGPLRREAPGCPSPSSQAQAQPSHWTTNHNTSQDILSSPPGTQCWAQPLPVDNTNIGPPSLIDFAPAEPQYETPTLAHSNTQHEVVPHYPDIPLDQLAYLYGLERVTSNNLSTTGMVEENHFAPYQAPQANPTAMEAIVQHDLNTNPLSFDSLGLELPFINEAAQQLSFSSVSVNPSFHICQVIDPWRRLTEYPNDGASISFQRHTQTSPASQMLAWACNEGTDFFAGHHIHLDGGAASSLEELPSLLSATYQLGSTLVR